MVFESKQLVNDIYRMTRSPTVTISGSTGDGQHPGVPICLRGSSSYHSPPAGLEGVSTPLKGVHG